MKKHQHKYRIVLDGNGVDYHAECVADDECPAWLSERQVNLRINRRPNTTSSRRGMTLAQAKDKYFPNLSYDQLEGREPMPRSLR